VCHLRPGVSFSTHVKAGMMNPSDFSGYKGFKGKGALEGRFGASSRAIEQGKTRHQEGDDHANEESVSATANCFGPAGHTGRVAGTNRRRRFDPSGSAGAARVRAAGLPRAGLHMDSRILGLRA